ncbi:MAG: 2-(1,2-epoxy-1,2-dihydrophenyl)acetyl-CoA isomerase PaaG [Gemmatimonadaceae bacterium]
MSSDPILREMSQGVLVLTLNRPDVLNSFNLAMAQALQAALTDAAADHAVRCVLLTGAGRGFCAGQDLASVPMSPESPPDVGGIVRAQYNPIIRAIRALEKPVVCAVNGVAAGAGANLALACDIVIAAAEASFIQSFAKIGLIPDSGGTWLLPHLVGMARASALMLLGDKLPATTAAEWGMIYQVVPGAELRERAMTLAAHLATQPTRGLGLTKKAMNAAMEQGLSAQLDTEAEIQTAAGRSHDFMEGVQAFLEKRKPVFTGK